MTKTTGKPFFNQGDFLKNLAPNFVNLEMTGHSLFFGLLGSGFYLESRDEVDEQERIKITSERIFVNAFAPHIFHGRSKRICRADYYL